MRRVRSYSGPLAQLVEHMAVIAITFYRKVAGAGPAGTASLLEIGGHYLPCFFSLCYSLKNDNLRLLIYTKTFIKGKMGYIYKITHKESQKSYIGQTVKDLEERWREHMKKTSNCRYLLHALNKYGKDAFEFKLICICFDEDLNRFEIDYMKKYNTISPNGYNLREGGNSGRQHEDTKKKISKTLKDKFARLEIIPNNGCLGKPLTTDHKEKISKTLAGVVKSKEMKEKLSESNKKYKVLQYTLDGILVNNYDGCVVAASAMSTTKGQISAACRGKVKTYKGFVWKYINRNDPIA